MAGGSANSSTTGRAITPNITVSREPRCSVRSTRALARRPTAATVIRIAPMGISHAVRVDRYSDVRPAAHTNQNSPAQAPMHQAGADASGAPVPLHPKNTWIHRVAASVVAPTAITTIRKNPRS